MLLKNRGKIEQDVKSRIVFEVPEAKSWDCQKSVV
jgi:hypothetical protein